MEKDFEEVIAAFTPVASTLLAHVGSARGIATASSCTSLLNHLVREIEDVCPRNVSRRARDEAQRLGLGDLRAFHWDDRRKNPLKRHDELFHWEHYWPVSQQVKDLLKPPASDERSIAAILGRTRIVWILKEEDARLQRAHRPDPAKAYAEAGIELMYPWDS
jgi:hypothetical protein